MSQADLANMAGLGRGTISNIMSGNRSVGQETLTKIAHALRFPPELVFEKAGLLPQKPELSALKRTLIHQIEIDETLPDSDIEMLINLLELRRNYYENKSSRRLTK